MSNPVANFYRSKVLWQGQTPSETQIRVRVEKTGTGRNNIAFLAEKLDKTAGDWVPAGDEATNTLARALVVTNGNVPPWARVAV